ncbi:MAG: HEAT repeat domain-containing protein [Planctomycetes bacterium]|nr:HEAT repeat domain-containing protein [Planctomycetota bacterium]
MKPTANDAVIQAVLKALSDPSAVSPIFASGRTCNKPGALKPDQFLEQIIIVLAERNESFQPYIFKIFQQADNEKLTKLLLVQLNQPEKPEPVRQKLVKGLAYAPSKKSIPFLIGLLTNRKSDLNTEIGRTLYAIAYQSFATREEWVKWWESNRNQPREKWLDDVLVSYLETIRKKDSRIKQLEETIASLKIDLLKMRLAEARRVLDANAETGLLTQALDDEAVAIKKYALEQIKQMDKEQARKLMPKLIEITSRFYNGASSVEAPNPTLGFRTGPAAEEIQLMIITLISELGGEKEVPVLITIFNNSNSAAVRNRIIQALGRIASPLAVPHLLTLLNWETPQETVLLVIEALGKIKSGDALPKLHEYLNAPETQKNETVCRAIIDVLGDFKDISSNEVIVKFLDDRRQKCRWSAANSLGKIGTPETAPHLVKLLQDEFADIRQVAVEALGNLGNKAVIADLARVLTADKDSRTRQLAAVAIGKFKDKETLNALLPALSDSDESVVIAVWSAINGILEASPDSLPETAQKLEGMGQIARAAEVYQKIVNHPNFKDKEMENRGKLGRLLIHLKQYKEALEHLQKAANHLADKLDFTLLLIECYKNLGMYDQALHSCDELLKDTKAETPLWWNLTIEQVSLLSLKKDYNTALEKINKLLTANSLPADKKTRLEGLKKDCEKALAPQ